LVEGRPARHQEEQARHRAWWLAECEATVAYCRERLQETETDADHEKYLRALRYWLGRLNEAKGLRGEP
jgi:hypothetical protein